MVFTRISIISQGFPGGAIGKEPSCQFMSGEGNGDPLQYSCLENPMEGGAL